MKRGRPTGKPTKEEAEWIVACKEGPCMACKVWHERGHAPNGWSPLYGCDFHHMKSGNMRRGHLYGIGLCPWHHRGVPDWDFTAPQMRAMAGPSLMDGGKLFAEAYGSDNELLDMQREVLGVSRKSHDGPCGPDTSCDSECAHEFYAAVEHGYLTIKGMK